MLGRNQGPDTGRHFGIAVDDKELARSLLEGMGVEFVGTRFLDFLDPWGNRVEITTYQNIQYTKADHVLQGMGPWSPHQNRQSTIGTESQRHGALN